VETWRRGDLETWRRGDVETWKLGDVAVWVIGESYKPTVKDAFTYLPVHSLELRVEGAQIFVSI
jgi:hypothetical protein